MIFFNFDIQREEATKITKKTSSFNYCIIFVVKIFYILDQKHAFFTSKKENYFEEMLVIINALLHVIV